ncbi:MAG TPA: 2'-5' RNA ligase family protein [Nocardioidaceae bacterium]|nr:2'-5' RNA ligase family protein [Nocardioidaceae bacterium]
MSSIGVAIAVPDPWGRKLQDYRTALGDPTAPGIPTHVTLVPPVEIDRNAVPEVERHLAEAAANHHAFRLHLRGTGTFRPVSPVVFAVVVEGISGCEQLALSIRRGPLEVDLAFPYHPHVTIAHDLDDECLDRAFEEQAAFEAAFTVDHFSLYVHRADAGWVPTRDFWLTAAG